MRHDPVAHRPAVDEKILQVRLRARYRRQPQPARQPQTGLATVDPHAGRAEFPAAQLRQPPGTGFPVGRRLQAQYRALVVPEMEPDREPTQRQTPDPFLNMTELGALATQELAPGGNVEEQLAHLDSGAQRMRRRHRLAEDIATVATHAPTAVLAGDAGGQGQPRHRSDAGQRLAAETQADHLLEILEAGDLAGGVAGQRQRQLRGSNAAAVVAHPDQPHPTLLHFDGDASRSGIQAVFQQFLDDRRRALDHFAGGDLADQLRRQSPNVRTHRKAYPATGRDVARWRTVINRRSPFAII